MVRTCTAIDRERLDRSLETEVTPSPSYEEASSPSPVPLPPEMYHYCVIRENVPAGVQLAQLAHAAGESAGGPLPENTAVVILGVPSEGALRHLSKRLFEEGIEHKLIVETDGKHAGQAMAIGCKPTTNRTEIRKLTSGLPLAGKPKKTAIEQVKERCDFFGKCVGGCSVCAYGTEQF